MEMLIVHQLKERRRSEKTMTCCFYVWHNAFQSHQIAITEKVCSGDRIKTLECTPSHLLFDAFFIPPVEVCGGC